MAESDDILGQHLNQVPEPLRGVIKEYLSRNILDTGLGDLKARHGLSDDQREAVLRECLMVLCHVTPSEELKDSLIAEADLSYETAVRIQRSFESEVLLPISTEAERRGYAAEKAGLEEAVPVQPKPATSEPLYDNPRANVRDVMQLGIQVFPGLMRVGGKAIPIRMVAGVKAWEEPTDWSGIAWNLGLAVVGAIVVLSFTWWSLLGVAMAFLGGSNLRNARVKKYNVTIDFSDREPMLVMFRDRQAACDLRDALELALRAA